MKFKFNGKKCLKISGIVLGVIVLLLIILLLSFSFIIRNGIYHAGPLITGVPMEIKHIAFNPFKGTLTIKDFIVGNPKGYSSPYAIKLGHLHVDVDMSTLFSRKLLLERIEVKGVELNYETALLKTNIGEIQDNVNRLAGEESNNKPAKENKPSQGKPLQINSLELRDITAWVIVKGTKAQAPLIVAPIVMTNLGTSPDGVSSVMVINDVLISMVTGVTRLIGADAAVKSISDLFSGGSKNEKKASK